MRKLLVLLCTMALLLSLSACVFAATVSYTANIPIQTTDWSKYLTVNQFDPALGTLNSISVSLNGTVSGDVQVENQNATPATVSTVLQATLTLSRPDMSTLIVSIPSIVRQFDATAYDGVLDYSGTSGMAYPTTSASRTESIIGLSSAADKALFTGFGTISMPCKADGIAGGSSAANLALLFSAEAGASATFTYDYTAVPEPSSLLALLSGVGGLAGFIIRRKK